MTTLARLQYFIDQLQDALGWQIDIEKEVEDDREYSVKLKFELAFNGKAWPDIIRNFRYRLVVYEMVKNRLDQFLDSERAKTTRASRSKGKT